MKSNSPNYAFNPGKVTPSTPLQLYIPPFSCNPEFPEMFYVYSNSGCKILETKDIHTEKELLLRIAEGDQKAFSIIYQRYHVKLYNYVLRFVKLPSLTEDLVHDVFVKIWEVRRRINPEQGFSGYLFRVTRNQVYKFIQRASRDKTIWQQLVAQMEKAGDSSIQILETKEYERMFREALDQLPPQRRRVFLLCRQEGKTYEEAAAILGISRNAIKKHMVLGVRSINEYVSRHGDIFLAIFIASHLL